MPAEMLDQRYHNSAIRVAHSIVRRVWPEPSDEAEDIANEAINKAIASLDQYDPKRPFWPWLRRIVQTTAIGRLRRFKKVSLLGEAASNVPSPTPLPEDQIENQNDRAVARLLIADAIDTLAPRDKELFLRFYLGQESFNDLAKSFDLAAQTVRGAVSKAKKAVLTRLGLPRITNRQMGVLLAI
jgi:RNA polymerase sigma-70 factor (ECF subfamily)